MKQVKIIKSDGAAVLVQWVDTDGTLRRGIVPVNVINAVEDDRYVDVQELAASIPYGDELGDILPDYGPPYRQILINELHRRGIWLVEEILTNHDAVRGAILKAFDLSAIFIRAREYQRRN